MSDVFCSSANYGRNDSARIHLTDTMIMCISNKDIAGVVNGNCQRIFKGGRRSKPSITGKTLHPVSRDRRNNSIRIYLSYAMVQRICYIDNPGCRNMNSSWEIQTG